MTKRELSLLKSQLQARKVSLNAQKTHDTLRNRNRGHDVETVVAAANVTSRAGGMEISQSLPTSLYAYLRLKREFMEELQYELLPRNDKLTYDLYFLRYGLWDGVGRPAIL